MHGTVSTGAGSSSWLTSATCGCAGPLQPGWPFAGWVVHEVALSPTQLELRLEVHTEATTFPATVGWHPWFRRRIEVGSSLEVDLEVKRWYPRGVDGLPLGTVEAPPSYGPWDDCFTA